MPYELFLRYRSRPKSIDGGAHIPKASLGAATHPNSLSRAVHGVSTTNVLVVSEAMPAVAGKLRRSTHRHPCTWATSRNMRQGKSRDSCSDHDVHPTPGPRISQEQRHGMGGATKTSLRVEATDVHPGKQTRARDNPRNERAAMSRPCHSTTASSAKPWSITAQTCTPCSPVPPKSARPVCPPISRWFTPARAARP